eukprot:TRINITY_DN3_c0_g1_i1.p1 TRINITY_DN3_c0_g1~~TRINITY_DN3_c0_g1_i1.p1  ORF type:complete len:202 (+),score=16.71 TRINITY_DN3_c0_g1_i1:212-817(+)
MFSACFKSYHQVAACSEECAICLEPFEQRKARQILPCGHEFHAGCAKQWISRHNSCPLCREVVSNTFSCHAYAPSKVALTTKEQTAAYVVQEPDRHPSLNHLCHSITVNAQSAELIIKSSFWRSSIIPGSSVKEFFGVDEFLLFTIPTAKRHTYELQTIKLHSVVERENLYKLLRSSMRSISQRSPSQPRLKQTSPRTSTT